MKSERFSEDTLGAIYATRHRSQEKLRRDVQHATGSANSLAETDPLAAARLLRQAADAVVASGLNQNEDVFLSRRIETLIMDYEIRESGGIVSNILWPWAPLNDLTGGITHEDYVLLLHLVYGGARLIADDRPRCEARCVNMRSIHRGNPRRTLTNDALFARGVCHDPDN